MGIREAKETFKNKKLKRKIIKLEKLWNDIGVHEYHRWGTRLLRPIELFSKLSKEKRLDKYNLLDIGCYNGVLSVMAAKYFNSVIGIERHKDRTASARITLKELGNSGNCHFKKTTFKSYAEKSYFARHDINAILATQVLYHMSTEEIDLLKKQLKNRIKFAMIGSRPNKKASQNKYDLRTTESVLDTLVKPYFDNWKIYYEDKRHPMIVAEK